MDDSTFDYLFKIVMVGDSGVGKTSFLASYLEKSFSKNTRSTVGVEFRSFRMDVENLKIKIQLWDTAGQERYRAITSSYYRGAFGIIIMYDICSMTSYNNTKVWIKDVLKSSRKNIQVLLVGNKIDLKNDRQVSTEEAAKLCEEKGYSFFETSAATLKNVNEAIRCLINNVVKFKLDSAFDDDELNDRYTNRNSIDSKRYNVINIKQNNNNSNDPEWADNYKGCYF